MRVQTIVGSTLATVVVVFLGTSVTAVTCSDGTSRLFDGSRDRGLDHAAGDASGSGALGVRIRVDPGLPDERVKPPPRPTHSPLTVRVLDESGTPCADAEVQLTGADPPALGATDPAGEVRYEAVIGARYGVFVTAPGLAGTPGASWVQPRMEHEIEVTLEPTRSVRGEVVEQDGQTPAGAVALSAVCAVDREWAMLVPVGTGAACDRDGAFVFAGLPRAPLQLTAQPASLAQGAAVSVRVASAAENAGQPVRIRFGFVASHEVVVVDAETGGPLDTRMIVVYALSTDGSRSVFSTHSTGTARLYDLDAEPTALLRAQVLPGAPQEFVVHAVGYEESDVLRLVADSDAKPNELEHVVRLRRSDGADAVVDLRISVSHGEVPGRLMVLWVQGGSMLSETYEVVDGVIALRLPPGYTRLEFSAVSDGRTTAPPYLPAAIALELESGERTSRAVRLVAGGTVHVRPRAFDDRTPLPRPRAAVDGEGIEHTVAATYTTDEQSNVLVVGPLTEGTWTILFEDDAVEPVTAVVRAGETTEVLLR